MLETDPSFRPIRRRDGYLPLEDLGLIGDGATVALVGLDGSIGWLCLPRFDSEPVFCGVLDHARGGHFTIAPEELTEARQYYEPDTGVLVTELRSPTGLVRLTDALALRSGADLTDDAPGGRGELVRSAVVLDGNVRLRVDLEPRGGGQTWMAASGLKLNPSRRPDLRLHLRSSRPLSGLHGTHDLKQGDSLDMVLSWGRSHRHHRFDAAAMLQGTAEAWRRWMRHFSYEGLQEPLVRRAAITLKLCDHWVNGSLVAAPTSSLPAPVGGCGTGITATPGSATRPSPSSPCAGSASSPRPTHSWAGCWTPSSRAGSRGSCSTSTAARCPMSGRTPSSKATGAPPQCDGATAQQTSASTMSTARYSTARTSGPAAAAGSSRFCGPGCPGWPTWPGRPGGSRTRASGRCAARAGSSPIPRRCARWPWTGPRPSVSGSACQDRSRPGGPPPTSCGRPSWTSPGTRMPRR
jgi:hypothetical protein